MESESQPRTITKVILLLDGICASLSFLFFVLMLALIFPGVVSRYLFNHPFHFVEEYSGYLFVGMGFLGLSFAFRRGAHISVTAFVIHLTPRVQKAMEIITTSLAIIVVIILGWFSFELCYSNWGIHVVSSTMMQTPLWIPQTPVWLGWFVFLLTLINHLIEKIVGLRKHNNVVGHPSAQGRKQSH